MADKGPATPKLATACKPPVKATQPAPLAQQEHNAVQCAQQDLVQPPPPAQVQNPVLPPAPPAQVHPPAPPAQVPNPVQPPAPPAQVPNPVQLIKVQVQPGQPHLNWSYFKPEFSGKPEDAEAHLLRINDWMETHSFPEVTKVKTFCLTLTKEARLWYESLRPIVIDWTGLQEQFRQQYSKFGNTQE